jgi:NodT family efflux transporter outer membrane factor (OMF) lipoprotein
MPNLAEPFLKNLTLLILVFVLNACAILGPDYQEPGVKWLDDWESDLYGQMGSPEEPSQVDVRFWWRLFDDPVLNGLIELAKQENPSLRIAGLRIIESRAALGIALSSRYPQVQQATGAIDYVNTQKYGGSATDRYQSLGSYQIGLNLGWELDFWGRFQRGIESADAAFFASIFNQQNVQVLLNSQVADLYFAYRTTLLRIDIARQNAKIQKRSYEITERLYKSGASSELDLQQAKTQYMATLSSIPSLEITQTQLRNALSALLGRAPGHLPELDSAVSELPVLNPVVIQDVPAHLLMRRPDIRAAGAQVAAQSAQIGIAEAELYPSISLFGTVGWSGNTLSGSPDTLSLGIGPTFTWNLFDYGRIKNNIRVQDARLQQAIENFQDSVLQAAREIDDAAISVVKTREQRNPQRESTRAAQRSLELANVRYREGYADFQRVIEAQRAFAAQTERGILNDSSHISAVISFYKAVGGGWLDTPVEQLVPETTRETMESRSDWDDLLNAPLPANTEYSSPVSEVSNHE